ncbi:hypothetical protein DL764_002124 [Monosporascus ibericus]|uniref:XPG-I domain-containing protein n=1 Tax=Monosporascus ibericus TaxID=155417 RepID=A0A4Q4TP84_9PEZI|nr:hypothetical protein DL764_002124 [Monosporascus ibericus]
MLNFGLILTHYDNPTLYHPCSPSLIYKEVGPGKRISLTKLAVEKLEQTGRPFRLAIDISIWQFQAQAARGGSNPAIRTLFYRLLRLLGLSIQPIFVFDGPNKPVFKRNKRSGRGDGVATSMAKRLIRLFGFQVHDAPGEAEAECALLQQQGLVDAVLSEDVDTIMFGCKRTLRNWSSEGTKAKTPTHVSMYDTEELRQGESGLDREGMVLVALMSGGDYLPEGIPGAGVKLACEAARAGFGKSLCQLKRSDTSSLNSWRERLIYELRTNESGFFRTRHKALHVPGTFPNIDVLRYYTHPVVSPASTLERLRNQTWGRPVDVQGLREFVGETFDWTYRIGAIKFIRVLAPSLLIRKLMDRSARHEAASEDAASIEREESELITSITTRRAHSSTDATSELRVSFIPTNIVGYDFQEEPEEVISYGRDGLALNSDDEFEALAEDEARTTSRKPFSPTEPDLFWIPETVAKLGIPLKVEDWEEAQRAKANKRTKAKAPRQKTKPGGASAGAMDKFVKVTKNISKCAEADKSGPPPASQSQDLPPPPSSSTPIRSPLSAISAPSQSLPPPPCSQNPRKPRSTKPVKQTKPTSTKPKRSAPAAAADSGPITDPWAMVSAQVSSPGIAGTKLPNPAKAFEAIYISSSPPASPAAHPRPRSPVKGQQTNPSPSNFSSSLDSSPSQKRRSVTPPPPASRSGSEARESLRSVRALSPTPLSAGTSRRKPARTESLPVEASPQESANDARRTRGLMRAQTVALETAFSDSGEDDAEDSDLDLPPLGSFVKNKLPRTANADAQHHHNGNGKTACPESPPPPRQHRTTATATNPKTRQGKTKQTTLDAAFGAGALRMTKLYMPRKSQPGYFKEVDVTVAEAEALKAHVAAVPPGPRGAGGHVQRGRVWRRSDVECIDLTGVD